jgi:hypothetical protein
MRRSLLLVLTGALVLLVMGISAATPGTPAR